jgi:hypothetical protein
MKRIFLSALVICLLFSFTIVYASNTSTNPTPVNEAIKTFKNSDGAASEDAVAELENLFFADPVAFVTDLSTHDAETQILIAQQLSAFIAGGYISEIEQFNAALSTLKASELDKVRATLVRQIESFFVEYYNSQAVVVESTKPAPVFDVEIIKGFIGTNKEAGFPFDEEFNAKLAECYRLDPRLFVKALENLNSDEIQIIAANIAIANENSKELNVEKQPADSSGTVLTEEEEQILADLESQIRSIHTQSPSAKGENVMAVVPRRPSEQCPIQEP